MKHALRSDTEEDVDVSSGQRGQLKKKAKSATTKNTVVCATNKIYTSNTTSVLKVCLSNNIWGGSI